MRALLLWCALLIGPGLTHRPAAAQVLSLVGGTARTGSSEHDGTRQGRLFGARIALDLTDRVELRFGPDYAERNLPALAAAAPGPNQVQTLAYEASYLELPLLLKVSATPASAVSPHLLIGPALGVRLGCGLQTQLIDLDATGRTISVVTTESGCGNDIVGRSAKTLQLDLRVGVGVDFNVIEPMKASIELVYGTGIYKIFEAFAAKPRATFIRIGLGMPIG